MPTIPKPVAILIVLGSVFLLPKPTATADDLPASRLLLIGIDGCRPDALKAATTPHLDSLASAGTLITTTRIQKPRYTKSDTSSGPGWSSFLTGVWANKHGVHDNSFDGRRYEDHPHVFRLIKERFPKAVTGSFVDWKPIDQFIVEAADNRVVYESHGADGYAEHDVLMAREAAEFLKEDDPHVAMVYFGAVDETGHAHGFHPDVAEYMAAIETVDERVGEVLAALRSRSDYKNENWLVVVSTDHGGKDKGHGGGQEIAEIMNTFLIVSGDAAAQGTIQRPTYLVDVIGTGLAHLGITPAPKWQIDGQPVGLKPTASTGLQISWKDRFLEVSGPTLKNGPIRTNYLEAYCRAGSTDREWRETVIPHASRLVSADADGKGLVIEDKLEDGVVVTHVISAGRDEVQFEVTATNPTSKASLVHWAQPCTRVDTFTGSDPKQAREVYPPYIRKCFVMLDDELTRLPTAPWTLKARYVPGQVYAAPGVDRNDVNPRPLSELVLSSGLTGCFSADETQVMAVAWEPWQEVFQGVVTCMHNDFRIGGLEPGESKTIRGRMYVLPADTNELLRRYEEDFGQVDKK